METLKDQSKKVQVHFLFNATIDFLKKSKEPIIKEDIWILISSITKSKNKKYFDKLWEEYYESK